MPAARFDDQVRACRERLRAMVARAELPEGARIDELQLRRESAASVRAVRAALADLAREGLIVRKRHVGTFVRGAPADTPGVLLKVRSAGILSSLGRRAFAEHGFAHTVFTGVQLALHPPAQVAFFGHEETRAFSIDDLPTLDPDDVKRACQGLVAVEAYNAVQLNDLARSGVPLVAVDFAPPNAAFDAVEADHLAAGYLAAKHLIALGHRRIAYIGEGFVAESSDPTWQARLNGWARALLEAGREAAPRDVADAGRSEDRIAETLASFEDADPARKPTAYVLATGGWAAPAMRWLRARGRRVPEDVSLAAADSAVYEAEGLTVAQARIDYEMLGRNAVRLLAARLACRSMPPVKVTIPAAFAPGQTARAANP
ncbi:MAG: substrate-binding domain-containing protein [Planctomycetes bacterium]|nr:substrate-binding domain-containing protein [Planctomycetota bacterium]